MRKIVLLLLTVLSFYSAADAQSFEIKDGAFLLNGKPMRIYGGEMHYARIPREYWQQRIQMAKAMGCNTLSIYVFWNYQETAPGVWDWTSDNHNLRAFVELAKSEGMYIVLRPGPYVCAEWDFGGFPYWLMNNPEMRLRSNNKPFLDSCRTYLQQVFKQVDGLFVEQGGNIIMTQVENEYGSFSFDMQFKLSHSNRKKYLENLADIFREVGFKHTLFTCDGGIIPVINFARLGHIKGLFPGTNDSKFLATAHHTVRKFYNKKGPYYIPEEYAGWFTHWGDAHVFHRDVEKYKKHIGELLKADFSFCYYMVHGGTNFGFYSGTNYRKKNEVWPVITSYDYGAPIAENGDRTPLYDSLRAVYQRATHETLREVPAAVESMGIDSIQLTNAIPMFSLPLGLTIQSKEPLAFEKLIDSLSPRSRDFLKSNREDHMPNMGCGDGYVLYTKVFAEGIKGELSTKGIMDFATIYINDSLIGTIDRNAPVGSVSRTIHLDIPKGGNLKILVESMGRVNFGKKLWDNGRGITKGIKIDDKPIEDWIIYDDISLPFSAVGYTFKTNQPTYYSGVFTLTHTADTYLDMHGFGKGVVFVNGHNLGRYWEIGPQYSLYVPGVWLKKGQNHIMIFDQLNHTQQHYISATARPVNR